MQVFVGKKANEIADKYNDWEGVEYRLYFPLWVENTIDEEFKKYEGDKDFEAGAWLKSDKGKCVGYFDYNGKCIILIK